MLLPWFENWARLEYPNRWGRARLSLNLRLEWIHPPLQRSGVKRISKQPRYPIQIFVTIYETIDRPDQEKLLALDTFKLSFG